MRHIVILTGSMRKGGNTDCLAAAFAAGAKEAGHSVELLSAADFQVHPCIGCNACYRRENHTCIQRDDMDSIYEKLQAADILVVASPVYFYGISAQLKAVIDRLHTPLRDTFPIQKLALLLVGAAALPNLFDAILMQYQMVLDFFHLDNLGTVLVRGVKEKGDIAENPALQEAFELGRSIQ